MLGIFFLFSVGCGENQSIVGPPAPSRKLLDRISREEQEEPNIKSTKYALLINGSAETRFFADISVAYQILLENDFKREDIYILDAEENDWYWYPIDGMANQINLFVALNYLKKKATRQDMLFVYVVDHGGKISKKITNETATQNISLSTLHLVDYSIDQNEFARYLEGLKTQIAIFIFDMCYSGGFAEEVGRHNIVAISGTQADKVGRSRKYDSFVGSFMLAFRNINESDLNSDGKVSIYEAFEYAKKKHSFTRNKKQVPFIQGNIDPQQIFLK
ncbi:MAG: C13 family peptidase [Patescibacteria group bacterium]